MSKLTEYSLYTFKKAKLVWTETESLEQAIYNFKNRVNLDHNGNYHSNMEYVFNPINIIAKKVNDKEIVLKQDLEAITKQLMKEE